jgi:hypothetical protein
MFNPVDLVVRSIALTFFFLFLTYLFRDKVVIEGFLGYAVIVGLLVPINVYLNSGGSLPGVDANNLGATAIAVYVLAFNIVIGLILNKLLPALSISSLWALLFFLIVFSGASALVRFVPLVPTIPHTIY